MKQAEKLTPAETKVEKITEFKTTDLSDICDATESTILDNSDSFTIGFSRQEPLVREKLENYWKGVLLLSGPLKEMDMAKLQLESPSPALPLQVPRFLDHLVHVRKFDDTDPAKLDALSPNLNQE